MKDAYRIFQKREILEQSRHPVDIRKNEGINTAIAKFAPKTPSCFHWQDSITKKKRQRQARQEYKKKRAEDNHEKMAEEAKK
eukprot:143871-Ditylum_brightwellii.AAC.1